MRHLMVVHCIFNVSQNADLSQLGNTLLHVHMSVSRLRLLPWRWWMIHDVRPRYKEMQGERGHHGAAVCRCCRTQRENQMDFTHRFGVLTIQHLQNNYRGYYRFLSFMSTVGDPRSIFSIYFPLWFHLSHDVGTKMIWVAVIGDWFNLIFKW